MTDFSDRPSEEDWGSMIKELSDMKESLTAWEREFVSSLSKQKSRFGSVANGAAWTPTPKQQHVIKKIIKDRSSSPWDN